MTERPDAPRPAETPPPPYYAVVFVSARTAADEAGYAATHERMLELVAGIPGYLGVDSARDPDSGLGITVAYFRDPPSIAAWRRHPEHRAAQRAGRRLWYDAYHMHIALVERAYRHDRAAGPVRDA